MGEDDKKLAATPTTTQPILLLGEEIPTNHKIEDDFIKSLKSIKTQYDTGESKYRENIKDYSECNNKLIVISGIIEGLKGQLKTKLKKFKNEKK